MSKIMSRVGRSVKDQEYQIVTNLQLKKFQFSKFLEFNSTLNKSEFYLKPMSATIQLLYKYVVIL